MMDQIGATQQIAQALDSLALSIDRLGGNNNVGAMGAIENLAFELRNGMSQMPTSIERIAMAIEQMQVIRIDRR